MPCEDFDIFLHNLGNILFSVSGLLLSERFDEAKTKLSKIFGPIDDNENLKDYRPIDFLIKSKIDLINKHGIKLSYNKLEFPQIDDIDLCLIFGNIFDNLINFSLNTTEKFISIDFKIEGKKYIYSFKNSFLNDKYKKGISKNVKEKIGLKTLKKTIKKNNGSLKLWSDRNVFHTYISLEHE